MTKPANATPCNCGKSDLRVVSTKARPHDCIVRCEGCGREAPRGFSDQFAVRNWNALMKDAA